MKGQLARWILEANRTREDVAQQLGVSRRYVDALCREQRVPKADVMDKIHQLTNGQITSAYWATVDRARKKSKP